MQITLSNGAKILVDKVPNQCPFCHMTIQPIYGTKHFISNINYDIAFTCSNAMCNKRFFGLFQENNNAYYFQKISFGTLKQKDFSDSIKRLSPNFVKIYNESFSAEQYGLSEVCGVGYRKALEFLIKEYLINQEPGNREVIEKKMLYPCIKDHVSDLRIKTVAERAVWLGNDETHYVRKWEGKNMEDLKRLIDLVVHWIEAEELTKAFELEMPRT